MKKHDLGLNNLLSRQNILTFLFKMQEIEDLFNVKIKRNKCSALSKIKKFTEFKIQIEMNSVQFA